MSLTRWPEPVRRAVHRTGIRGLFLLNLGVLDLLYGATLAWPTPEQVESVRYHVITDEIPGLGGGWSLWIWAALWWAVAVICLCYAWHRDDDVAYACAFGLKVAWAIVNAFGFSQGAPDGASQVITWIAFAVAVGLMSRMPEPIIRTD